MLFFFCIRNMHETICIASVYLHGKKHVLYFYLPVYYSLLTTFTIPQFCFVVCDLFPVEFPWNYGKSTHNTSFSSSYSSCLNKSHPYIRASTINKCIIYVRILKEQKNARMSFERTSHWSILHYIFTYFSQ